MAWPDVLVEFFFDTSSPWTYLAFTRIREICLKNGASLHLRPFLVGGVFNVANKGLYAARDKLLQPKPRQDGAPPKPSASVCVVEGWKEGGREWPGREIRPEMAIAHM